MTDPTSLTMLTVNLVPKAYQALVDASEITGDSRTDTVNRALQRYASDVRFDAGYDAREARYGRWLTVLYGAVGGAAVVGLLVWLLG